MQKLYFSLLLTMFTAIAVSQMYITPVTIADVEKHRLVNNQTVIITNDKITKIQPASIKIPANATVIDGTGKYLLPGLTDAHIHFFQNGGLYARPDVINLTSLQPYAKERALAHKTMEDKLRRYLQNGITNLIDVGASYSYLKQRENFKDADYAPGIFITGPLLTTFEPEMYKNLGDDAPFSLVTSVDDGIRMVQAQLPYRPNLTLLNANPVDSVENLSKIQLVINRGVVFMPDTLVPETPVALAQRQLNAYNSRNIDAFLEPYADDVEIYNYPATLMTRGKEAMRKIYTRLFTTTPDLHCELVGRIEQGNVVIDKERVKMNNKFFEAVAIYHIENNKIKKVYFIQ